MESQADSRCDALLVGYENQENLGLRSIVAFLGARGWRVCLVPFAAGLEQEVLARVQALRPRLVGFSLIFQYSLDDFAPLLALLRTGGVRAHFTAGGHFPSLRPEQTLELLPQLDSIVRFEGEQTTAELLAALDNPDWWPRIRGLAFRQGQQVAVTPVRPLIEDLDSLPPVHRDPPREAAPGIRVAAMLASRGCLYDCAFCSIRQFYGSVPGARRRVRTPASVVAEILRLFEEQEVRFFSFQDDDFAARTPAQRRWVAAFLDGLGAAGLKDRVRWKISCRVDDLEPALLAAMVDHGLAAVYLGVESGNNEGLRTLNKRVTVSQNLTAIDLLKSAAVAVSIGFMLFDPSSTFDSLRENIAFLRRVGDDGYFPVNFCQMLPYAGTPIEAALRASGRLQGTATRPTYGFLDPRLDWYSFIVQRIFTRRNFHPAGTVALLQQADFVHRLGRSFGHSGSGDAFGAQLRHLIGRSNRQAVDILEELLGRIRGDGVDALLDEQQALLVMADREWRSEADIEVALAAMLASGVSAPCARS
jgi:anaerobic magnesium-protoporphyrin IX monomethyl ester cyclase